MSSEDKSHKTENETDISKPSSLEEIADFWDTHSLADHGDRTHEAEFEMKAKRKHRVTRKPIADILERLAEEALAEHRQGRTRELDPDKL